MSFKITCRMVICILLFWSVARAQEATPAQTTMGWRGDGSGRFPDAKPPLDFGRIAKSVKELSAQSRKPKDGELPSKESAIPDGVIRQWLVLGPLTPPADSAKADELIANAETLSPSENEKVGETAWKAVTAETSCLDLCAIFNVPPAKKGMVAYAHTYIYSPSGQPVRYDLMFQGQGTNRAWLNGAPLFTSPKNIDIPQGGRVVLPLQKGWNRLLIVNTKTVDNYRKSWWICGSLYGDKPDYDTHGIVWMTPFVQPGSSAPIIVGDRLYFTAEYGTVVCVNKADGKLLWVHTTSYYDFATDEERKANPDVFKELDVIAAKIKDIDKSYLVQPWKVPPTEADWWWGAGNAITKGMSKVSHQKYNSLDFYCEVGFTACNPVTDGKFIYALFGTGIVVCFDRDGNLQWKRLLNHDPVEHGYTTSPILVDGKLVVYFNKFTVLNAKTGETILERPHFLAPGKQYNWYAHFHGAGVVLQAGTEKVLYFLNGEFVRLSDGKSLTLDDKKLAALKPEGYSEGYANRMATPVIENGVAYKIVHNLGGVVSFKLPPLQGDKVDPEFVRQVPFNTDNFPYYYEYFYDASPLLHDGLLYCVNDFGTLTVLDMVKGEVVYQRQLDLEIFMPYNGPGQLKGGASASPTLAGKYIYIFGDQGTVLIMEPGRTFKQVAKTRVENLLGGDSPGRRQEATTTAPIFEGERMYFRAESTLYCVGPK